MQVKNIFDICYLSTATIEVAYSILFLLYFLYKWPVDPLCDWRIILLLACLLEVNLEWQFSGIFQSRA